MTCTWGGAAARAAAQAAPDLFDDHHLFSAGGQHQAVGAHARVEVEDAPSGAHIGRDPFVELGRVAGIDLKESPRKNLDFRAADLFA